MNIIPVLPRLAVRVLSCLLVVVTAQSVAVAESTSLLWKISGNGLEQPSFLYGTIHIKDKRVFDLSDAAEQAFAATPTFAMEILPDSAARLELMPLLFLDSGRTIEHLLPREDYLLVHDKLEEVMGVQSIFVERMKPVFISTFLTMQQVSQDYAVTLDEHFYGMASEQNKQIVGLETVEEQMTALDALPVEEQARALVEQLRNQDKTDSLMSAMIDLYIDADLDALMELFVEAEMSGEAYDALMVRRNHVMAERIVALARQQAVFAAVGAGHLGGDDGIIGLLREQGFTVEPVY